MRKRRKISKNTNGLDVVYAKEPGLGSGIPKLIVGITRHPWGAKVTGVLADPTGEYGIIGKDVFALPIEGYTEEQVQRLCQVLVSPQFKEFMDALNWGKGFDPGLFAHMRTDWFMDTLWDTE